MPRGTSNRSVTKAASEDMQLRTAVAELARHTSINRSFIYDMFKAARIRPAVPSWNGSQPF